VVGRLVHRAREAGELRADVTVADVLLVIASAQPPGTAETPRTRRAEETPRPGPPHRPRPHRSRPHHSSPAGV
ncbi:hypothetical protein ACWCO4_30745, partial [Streptomyces virginiae]